MPNPTKSSLGLAAAELRDCLQQYIEATYHISNESIIEQRRELLDREGVIYKKPYFESTPKYFGTREFNDLNIPSESKDLLSHLTAATEQNQTLLNDPPYDHQAEALEAATNHRKSLLVATGTGSGKTECFLLPILANLAVEARRSPESFKEPAVRAMLLYPMNALVNDQLGRMRQLLGDNRARNWFTQHAGRPARFARYTSRTPYPGVRTPEKDKDRLRSLGRFYIETPQQSEAFVEALKATGKWPAKPDLESWYGKKGSLWQDKNKNFIRAVTRQEDAELITRHEVIDSPPDLLITNYAMLEYMLVRPIERPIFDKTRRWLENNPHERFTLVVDEAHLYRGSAGAEVALLIRRLRTRLSIPADRLQVVCTSASFSNLTKAQSFAGQLSGKNASDFTVIKGTLDHQRHEDDGSEEDAQALATVQLDAFRNATQNKDRLAAVAEFLNHRPIKQRQDEDVSHALHNALHDFPPMSRLINTTMEEAKPLAELSKAIFPNVSTQLAEQATAVLIALGSFAKRPDSRASLLPCRIHAFFRGLAGLWACIATDCSEKDPQHKGSPIGKLYSQPRDTCDCGARVFEFFTCRICGSAYVRAYTDDVEQPNFVWANPGSRVNEELEPLDLLLQPARQIADVEPRDLDTRTGRIGPDRDDESKVRQIFTRKTINEKKKSKGRDNPGEFDPCGVCGENEGTGDRQKSSVQDHRTTGDQPFQNLVSRQIELQAPEPTPPTSFAPLQGRKVLTFSDSRQTAARLAPNLQTFALRDAIRPLICLGWRELEDNPNLARILNLDDVYLAVLVGASKIAAPLQARSRQEDDAMFSEHLDQVGKAMGNSLALARLGGKLTPPLSIQEALYHSITNKHLGLQSLALAVLRESPELSENLTQELPSIKEFAEQEKQKRDLVRLWLQMWTRQSRMKFEDWDGKWQGDWVNGYTSHGGNFRQFAKYLGTTNNKFFQDRWLPKLLDMFCGRPVSDKYHLEAKHLSLEVGAFDKNWVFCPNCAQAQRPFIDSKKCSICAADEPGVRDIDPDKDTAFKARKGFYRDKAIRALRNETDRIMSLTAAEHTAQLNAANRNDVFSKAEEHELLFQDIEINTGTPGEHHRVAVDVLSCTTTMEVGIDIGTLSGVALRNMPPSRANYQQRAGRAGRRGTTMATVIAYSSNDSHDENYFSQPDTMIRGPVDDPELTLDNLEITRRHVAAFLLQKYHESRLGEIVDQPQLFEVLGTIADFKKPHSTLNRDDLKRWMEEQSVPLRNALQGIIPDELNEKDRSEILENFPRQTLEDIDNAIEDPQPDESNPPSSNENSDPHETASLNPDSSEFPDEVKRAQINLLDRLLYKGVLPRYAFPTDVVAFHVFKETDQSGARRKELRYAPSQDLKIALTTYAPGKAVWVDGQEWHSKGLYAPATAPRAAWQNRRLYFECDKCGYAKTEETGSPEEAQQCPACHNNEGNTLAKARPWIRPPGFAHPYSEKPQAATSETTTPQYATRAKLSAPYEDGEWQEISKHLKVTGLKKKELIVTNRGPKSEGYKYCERCGAIEPATLRVSKSERHQASHREPTPMGRQCDGEMLHSGLVLGTSFVSDVGLISIEGAAPLQLGFDLPATHVALRTTAEALVQSASTTLEIEPGELQAEYRPSMSLKGTHGLSAEIYLYDTLPGGAGFARAAMNKKRALFEKALDLLLHCPADCDRSCYRCLRRFNNRFEHDQLDRHLGASLLTYTLKGILRPLPKERIDAALTILFEDLQRHEFSKRVDLARNEQTQIPGLDSITAPIKAKTSATTLVIAPQHPLTAAALGDTALQNAQDGQLAITIHPVNPLEIEQDLPNVTKRITSFL